MAGLWGGRHIDAHGPRAVMTFGSILAVPGLLGVALAPTLPWFYAGWVLVGAAMAGTLYPPAFAALTRWGGSRRIGALTTPTLVAGLASIVFAPLASVLDDLVGWRLAYMLLLGGLVVITAPLHWWGLNELWEHSSGTRHESYGSTAQTAGAVTRSRAFRCLMIANILTALAIFAVIVNLVPMLVKQGMSRDRAAMALGLGGLGQVAGRLGYARFARSTTVVVRAVLVMAGVAVATAAVALAPATDGLLIAVGMLLGLARGIYTLVQAAAITDRWGSASYGMLNGVLTAPILFAAAVAPLVGAGLADLLGSYAHAFLLLVPCRDVGGRSCPDAVVRPHSSRPLASRPDRLRPLGVRGRCCDPDDLGGDVGHPGELVSAPSSVRSPGV